MLIQPAQRVDTFPDGLMTIRSATERKLGAVKGTVRYEEQSVGVARYYQAEVDDVHVSRVIKVPLAPFLREQDVAIDAQGRQYWIKRLQLKPERRVYIAELESIPVPLKAGDEPIPPKTDPIVVGTTLYYYSIYAAAARIVGIATATVKQVPISEVVK